MRLRPLTLKLLRDLSRIRGQGIAIALVVGLGVALMVATYGCVDALDESMSAFYERYRFANVFAPLKRAPKSLEVRISKIPGIGSVQTRVVADVVLDIDDMKEPAIGRLISFPEHGKPTLNDVELIRGSFIDHSRPDEVLVTEGFAEAHSFELNDSFKAIINGHKRKLRIVGMTRTPEYIFSLAPGALMPDDKRFGAMWMGREAIASAFDLDGAFNNVTVSLLRNAVEEDVIQQLDTLLKPYGGVGAIGRKDQISNFFLTNELEQLKSTGYIAPIIFLSVAAFLVYIVMTRIVTSEREQIGLLKAFGYTDWEVGQHYLKIVLILTGIGLIIGLGLGIWLGQQLLSMYSNYYKFPIFPYRLDPAVFSVASIISIVAGVGGGSGAVQRAIDLSPAVAMAPPVPTSYRTTVLTLLGDRLRLTQPTRMIFRHVLRWPIRSALTITGIAFSLALWIGATFFLDSITRVVDVYFFQAERQNLTINFYEPRPAIVEEEIRKLPGILATQPVRSVVARLRHGHHIERTVINGIIAGADLNRILNKDLQAVNPPSGGLALSAKLAEDLNVTLGDLVTVEVLQERRPVKQLPVTRIVEEYMGFAAYMHLSALNQLLREGPTVTAIYASIDSRFSDKLYTQLKNIPVVSGVVQHKAALKNFKETMESTMYVLIGTYVVFASIIAFGVSYISARLAFAERSKALASLRVLGFSRAEAAYILLGEIGTLTLISLPLGCLMGQALALVMSPMLESDMYKFPMVIDQATYGYGILVVTLSACTCAAIMCHDVYKLDLISVMKARE